jgi:Peptidase A4 family
MRATPFDPLPKDFNPSKASEDLLHRYGFPVGRWKDSWKGCKLIQPTFDNDHHKKHHYYDERDSAWSGVVVEAPKGQTINAVRGIWKIPKAHLPDGAAKGIAYAASSWLGIDGNGESTDVLQVGVDSMVCRDSRAPKQTFVAWWSWVPSDPAYAKRNYQKYQGPVKNFEVSAGDTLDCQISMDEKNEKEATVYLRNQDRNAATSFKVPVPRGTKLRGNCAEWIVEKIDYQNNSILAEYDDVEFKGAEAITNKGKVLRPGVGSGVSWRAIEIVDSEKRVISKGSSNRPAHVRCFYVNRPHLRAMSAAVGKASS